MPIKRHESPRIAKRLICALLALGGLAGLVVNIAVGLHAGQVPTFWGVVWGLGTLVGSYVFGAYAILNPSSETGVLSEPSEKVKELAIRPETKLEAIQAYRQQTGVDIKRAREVVERLASLGGPARS